jgi:hypothetical protein
MRNNSLQPDVNEVAVVGCGKDDIIMEKNTNDDN